MSVPQSYDNLSIFWLCLKLMGINVGKNGTKRKAFLSEQKSRINFAIFLLISTWNIWLQIRNIDRVTGAKYVTMSIIGATGSTIIMYLTLMRASEKLKALRKIIAFRQVGSRTDTAYISMYAVSLIALASPIIYSAAYFSSEDRLLYYSVYNFQNSNIRNAFSVTSIILVTYSQITVPALFNIFFCAVCYQWTMVIKSVTQEVERKERDVFSDPSKADIANSLLEECRFLWSGAKQMKEVFSHFLFFQVLSQVTAIFTMFAFLVKFDFDTEFVCLLAVNVAGFTTIVYLASQIPESMKQLVAILRELDEESAFKNYGVKLSVLQIRLKMITSKKPIALSIGGWADMNKSFITATFGAILTYGLIIMQASDG